MMDQTVPGRGGLRVGRYGFGGAPIAGLFDTAPHYGAGLLTKALQIDEVCSRHGVPIEDSSRFIATPMPEQLWADLFAAELLRPGAPGPRPSNPTTTHNPPPQKAVSADS
ncbi:MAG TPA: hypothetical protein VFG00_07735 [Acidothermaceae bacterium]|nr:hypothetical protein [Acidothermaceae bacterium]